MNLSSPWPWFAGTGLFLGLGLPLAKAAAQHGVSAMDFALWPTLAAGVLLAVLAFVRHGAPAWTGPLLRFAFVAGLLGHAAPMTLVFWLSAHAGAGFAALAFTLPPVFTLGIALALRLQRADVARVAAVAIGLAGALLLATARGGSYHVSLAGMLGLLAVPALIGAGNVYRSLRLPRDVPGEWLGALTLLASSALLLAGRAVAGGGAADVAAGALPVLGAQVFALAAGYACYFALQRRAEPVLFSFMGYVMMATGVAAGMAAFGERPAWTTVPALALIGAALALMMRAAAPPRAAAVAATQGERA